MVAPTTVKLAPGETNTLPTDAMIEQALLEGTKIFAEVGKVTGDDDVQVWCGVGEEGLFLTVSGMDWTNVANWPCMVLKFYPESCRT